MLLKMVSGCVADSLTVDGIEEYKLTDEVRKDVVSRIAKKLGPGDLNVLMQLYLTEHGDYKCDDEPCPTCGDYVEEYTAEI